MTRRRAATAAWWVASVAALAAVGACGNEGAESTTGSAPSSGVMAQAADTQNSPPPQQEAKTVLVRLSKCGLYPAGKLSSFAPSAKMLLGGANSRRTQPIVPTMPGSWWCLNGALLVEPGAEVPAGPLLTAQSPLAVVVSIPGVQWLPEKRREIAFTRSDLPPGPRMGNTSWPVALANPAYVQALDEHVSKVITTDPEERRQACEAARNVVGDPEVARAKVMEFQQQYLEDGNTVIPGNPLTSALEVLHIHCDPRPGG